MPGLPPPTHTHQARACARAHTSAPGLSAEWIRRELGREPGQCFGRRRRPGQCMTNECVMHTVEPGLRPARLIRLVNTAQVNLTTKTPSLLLLLQLHPPTPLLPVSGKGSRELSWFGSKEERRTEAMKGRVARVTGNYGRKRWNEEQLPGREGKREMGSRGK